MSKSPPLLVLERITKDFPSLSGATPVQILRNVSIKVSDAESLAIIGPSGSGKSTLLNVIGTLDRPTRGSITLEGDDLAKLDEDSLALVRNRKIGFVFQAHHLLPQCSVLENVLLPTLASDLPNRIEDSEPRARRLLDRVGLSARLSHRPGQLSGGERQRVAVVRALINAPKLLLADEPTGALDRASAENLAQLLVELNREEGVALIVVTHSMQLAKRMRRICELTDGDLRELESTEGDKL
ncbi:MAG: ABC transporter ATP-binding protein [Verrucomicrobia bacterium]|nr:ABC transporter ATP-binding protein [Verrucomicrobiota bacterium]